MENGFQSAYLVMDLPYPIFLFLADDLLLFAEASEDQMEITVACLNQFCSTSRQKVNLQKSCMTFSKEVNEETARKIAVKVGLH